MASQAYHSSFVSHTNNGSVNQLTSHGFLVLCSFESSLLTTDSVVPPHLCIRHRNQHMLLARSSITHIVSSTFKPHPIQLRLTVQRPSQSCTSLGKTLPLRPAGKCIDRETKQYDQAVDDMDKGNAQDTEVLEARILTSQDAHYIESECLGPVQDLLVH